MRAGRMRSIVFAFDSFFFFCVCVWVCNGVMDDMMELLSAIQFILSLIFVSIFSLRWICSNHLNGMTCNSLEQNEFWSSAVLCWIEVYDEMRWDEMHLFNWIESKHFQLTGLCVSKCNFTAMDLRKFNEKLQLLRYGHSRKHFSTNFHWNNWLQ